MPTQKELMDQANKDYGTGGAGNFFRFEGSGNYKLRVLTPCYPMATHFLGKGVKPAVCYGVDKGCPFHGNNAPKDEEGNEKKPSVKFVGYVIDRKDGKIKLAELPYSVTSVIGSYQEDEDWAFDDFPMPYDLKVAFDKDAAPAKMYTVSPSPNRVPLTDEEAHELAELLKKRSPEVYVEQRKDKQRSATMGDAALDAVGQEIPAGYEYPEDDGQAPPF